MKYLTLTMAVFLAGCDNAKPERKAESVNKQVTVEVLTHVDGCIIYRFDDGSGPHYFVRCNGDTATVIERHNDMCGKIPCPHYQYTPTVR